MNDSCDSFFAGIESSYVTSRQGLMLTWGLASVFFMFVLVGLVWQTCRILGRLRCCHPLRGSVNGAKLKMKVRKWVSILFILVVSIQMIVCQLFVKGGVHIRPDQLSVVIQVQALMTCGAMLTRLGIPWSRDHIGPSRVVGIRRFSPSYHRSAQSNRCRAVLFCFCILGSHATQAINHVSRFANPDGLQNDDFAEHEGDRFERSTHMHRAVVESGSEIEAVSTPYGEQDFCELTPNNSWGSGIQALSEAHDYLEEMSDHLSSPCEGDHFGLALTMRQEGDGRQSASSEADRLNIDLESMGGVDNGPPFLGSFVFRTRTQDHCDSELCHSLCNQKQQISNSVFEHEVVRAKAWFAPDGGHSS